jgi:tape measure domain-containing protein
MAEYRVEFTADSSAAERSIKALKREIKGVTKEFEGAEIGAADFLEAASDLSGLQKELKDARSAVVDIDGAYKKLSQTMAQFRSGMGARGAIPSVASPVRGTAQQFGSPEYFSALNKNLEKAISEGRRVDAEIEQAASSRQQAIANFRSGMGAKGASWVASSVQGTPQQFGSPAYFDALNKSLKRAIDEGRQLDAEIQRAADSREQAITAFRSGMGARGAIPAIASPIRGGMEYGPAYGSAGSPAYLEEVAKAAKKAQQKLDEAAKAAGTIAPPARAFQPLSLASYEVKLQVLKREARLISPSDVKWKELNKQILQAERGIGKINKMQKLGPTAGQRAGAAGGAFLYGGGMGGGIGSAVGGIAGGLAGGVPGAFAGAAIGQVADNLGTALAGITSQAAAVQKMQRGLAMASVDAKDFAEAQASVGEMSQKLLMPLEQTTKYFAQLRANTKEYNLSVAETRQILEGTALAIMATGGSAEDLDGAMRAVVQIMSKGGVQAEELRGQLGERFPGAVVKFAQANKLSFEELQSRLEDGTVGIREFIEFAKKNYTDYAKFSEQLATAPEYAGQRLKMALEQLSLEVGSLFGPMGAGIQDALTSAINGISKFVKDNRVFLRQMIADFGAIAGPIVKVFAELLKVIAQFSIEVGKVFQNLFAQIASAVGRASIGSAKVRLDAAMAATKGKTRPTGPAPSTTLVAKVLGLGNPFAELDAAQKTFNDLGGQAAFDKANAPAQPTNLTFGGLGAGTSIDRQKEDKEKKDSLEAFERLRDQLANAYNKAEIERIKAEYELRKRLQEDLYDMQEFGANRLQRQNLQFLRALAKAEQDRQDVAFSGQLEIAEAAGRVAPSAPVLPPAGIGGTERLPGSISGRLDASGQNGADMPVALNNIMRSYHNGIVTEINRAGNNGNYVVVEFLDDLGNKLEATYSHVAAAVKVGQSIVGGQAVGRFDASGRTFGAHNSVDINSPGTNGALQRNRESAAARRSADILVTGRVQGSVGAGAPRAKVGSNEIRDTMAGANTGIAQDNAALANRNAIIVKGRQVLKDLGRYMQEAYNVPDLDLDNRLLKARNDLTQEGLDENVINYKIRLLELDIQYQDLLKAFPGFANAAKLGEEDRVKILAILAQMFGKAKDAEKAKNDETLRGIEIEKKRERDKYIKSLQDEIKLLLIIGEEERKLAEIKAQYGEERSQEIFDLEKIKKNIEETRALIDGFVTQTSSDYKGFLKAVISGEDAVDALKQFQQGLKDRVLTIFFDFAMAPVEKFMKEAMEGLLLPKTKKEAGVLPEATTKDPVEATNINTNATNTNTTELKNLTTAIQGMGAGTNAAPSVQGPTAGNAFYDGSALPSIAPGFDAGSVFGNPEALTGAFANIQSSISTSMEGITSSFQMGADSLANTLPSWSDSLTTALPAALTTSTAKTNSEVPNFQASLGKVAAGIGIAAGSIMGIAAGISQIKEGGTSNVLGGIGSIMTSIGGGIMGFMNLGAAANGAVWNGGFQAFANGGTVTGPTLGLIGEGKYNEAIVPLPDGRSIPVQMRGGSSRDLLNAPGSAPAAPTMLSMSFQSTTINGVEYVDRAQLEAAMAETRKSAARDGASRGASLALDKLQNSPSARRRIGIR